LLSFCGTFRLGTRELRPWHEADASPRTGVRRRRVTRFWKTA
jgi:hypothetical protein